MFRSVAIGVVSFVLCAWGRAAVYEKPPLTVIVYNDAGVPSQIVKEAQGITERIYRNAGLAIDWRDRRDSDWGGATFFVRIIPSSRSLRGEDFGVAFVGEDGLGVQADVFYSGIEHMAQSSSVNAAELLGHVMAHELGHLLLGLDSHSGRGIMRARWESSQLRQIAMGILGFDRREAETMRARLLGPYAARLGRTNNAGVASVTKVSLPPL